MRASKLYLEIFMSFVLAIIVSETMIFFLFTDSERRIVGYKLAQNTVIKVEMLKKLVDEKIGNAQDISILYGQDLKILIDSVESTYDAVIWISDDEGLPLIPPGDGKIPEDISLLDTTDRVDDGSGLKLYSNIGESGQVYTSIPLAAINNETPVLFIAFNVNMPPHHRWQFFLGLLVIGLVVAFLIIPVSKFITDRIKGLKTSALRIAKGELSHRVTVKTRDEIGELGVAFNQMADRLERMILGGRELTANISHELRTPLARIRIAHEMLAERLERGDLTTCDGRMKQILENIEELDTLIGRILDLSKLDIHEVPLRYELFSPGKVLDELLEKLDPVMAHKKLSIKKSISEDRLINGDRTSLTMALSNILDNATKFSPEEGTIRIAISPNNSLLSISITNTYDPLPDTDLEKIFEPFFRSMKSSASGTGLGLSIAAKIIKKHGGKIRAANTRDGFEICMEVPVEGASKVQRLKSKA